MGTSDLGLPPGYTLEGEQAYGLPPGYQLEGNAPTEGHENLIQRAIRNSRIGSMGGTSITAALPSSGQEAMDLPSVIGRQIPGMRGGDVNFATQGPIGIGLNMAGIHQAPQIIQPPQTQYGKNLETSTDVAPWAFMGAELAPQVIQGSIKGIGSLFDVAGARRNLSDVIRNSAESVEGRIGEFSKGANKQMSESLGKVGDTGITQEHINTALQNTANKLDPTGTTHTQMDAKGNPLSAAAKVLSHVEPIDPNTPSPSMSGPQVQAKLMDMRNKLSFNSAAQAEFNTQLSSLLPDSLRDIKSARAGAYNIAESAQPLTKIGNLGRIAKGTMGPEELSRYQSAEKGLGGLNTIQDLIKAGGKINSAKRAQEIAKWTGITGGAGGIITGIYELLKHLILKGSNNPSD